jgi:predicted enzyme related to lactoylglutathione lyase
MIQYKEIAFIAYPVADMTRARKFYEGVLGLMPNGAPKSDPPHWIEYDIGAGTLGIGSSPQWLPSQDGASAALEVIDFEAAVSTLQQHQIPFVMGPLDFPSCQMVTVRDPDGNKITLHKRKRG